MLSILVNGNNGADHIKVKSTSGDVPVKVDGGSGDDVITVGDGSLTGIVGVTRPGLNSPYGVGPLVIIGGDGVDTIILDASTDATAYNDTNASDGATNAAGTLNAWTESRPTDPKHGVQVGAIGGLGTVLYPTALDFKGSSNDAPGRIEFETVEALTVKLGSAGDTFTVGGDALEQQLPPSRQEKVLEFDQSPKIMTTVIGGAGADTLRVVSTVDVARSAVNSTEGVVSINDVAFRRPVPAPVDLGQEATTTATSRFSTSTRRRMRCRSTSSTRALQARPRSATPSAPRS